MEEVLAVSARPADPARPVVCLAEPSRHRLAEARPSRHDPGDGRAGVVNLFVGCEPLRGWRPVGGRDERPRGDGAHGVRDLGAVHHPEAAAVVLVLDRRNTHSPASHSAAWPPVAAKRLAATLESPHTPAHGSWLTLAALEWSAVPRRCRDRRVGDRAPTAREVGAWATARTGAGVARTKRRRLAPPCPV